MKPAILHSEAEAELREALEHYETRRAGLGGDFRREFQTALERVRDNPFTYAVDDDTGARYCPLRRFPYTLVYLDTEDHIWVAALAHQRRRPGYWLRRQPE